MLLDAPSKDLEWVDSVLKVISLADKNFDSVYGREGRYRLYGTRFQRNPPPSTCAAFTSNTSGATEAPEHNDTLSFIHHQTLELRLRAHLRVLRGYSNVEKHLIYLSGSSTGDPKSGFGRIKPGTGDANMRQSARARVYDLKRYGKANDCGRLMSDGTGHVDWEQMDALLVVVGMNIHDHVTHDHHGLQDHHGHDDSDKDERPLGQLGHHPTCPHVLHPSGFDPSRAYSAPGCSSMFEFASGAQKVPSDDASPPPPPPKSERSVGGRKSPRSSASTTTGLPSAITGGVSISPTLEPAPDPYDWAGITGMLD